MYRCVVCILDKDGSNPGYIKTTGTDKVGEGCR